MGSLSRGWMLAKMSLGVIKKDKEILVFPLISVVCTGIVAASFIFGAFMTGSLSSLASRDFSSLSSPIGIASLFSGYFLLYFITVYFNVALIGCATIRFEGGDPTVRDGFRTSNRNLKSILMWTLLAATVGVILRVIEQKVKDVGRIITGIVGLAWSVATFFAVPVLIYEKKPPLETIRRSAELFRRTWGEAIVGGLGIGLIFFLLGLAGVIPIILAVAVGSPLIGFVIALPYWLVLACVGSAADSALKAALYRYATKGKAAPGFGEETLSKPWGEQQKRSQRRSWGRGWWPVKPGEI